MYLYEMLSMDGGRAENEDCVGVMQKEEGICFVLADGLGGHGRGLEASHLVTEVILNDFKKHGEVTEKYIGNCFDIAQEALLQKQEELDCENEMKTTLVVLLLDKEKALWGHIGDSRLYYFQNNKYQLRTLDHSVPQMLVAAGEITEKEIRGHADRNRLLRVMGTEWDKPRYQISTVTKIANGAVFLLCTDGFWELVDEKCMTASLRKSDTPKEWISLMEKELIKKGKKKEMDNYSAIAVFTENETERD